MHNKIIEKIKWHLKELNKTLSNQPSYYSSKRIERMILFLNALAIVDLYVYKEYSKLTSTEVIAIFTAQMLYAGFQTKQIFKDVNSDKLNNQNEKV